MRYFVIFALIFLLLTNVFGNKDDSTKVIIQKKFPKMDLNKINNKINMLKAKQNVTVDTAYYTQENIPANVNSKINNIRIISKKY